MKELDRRSTIPAYRQIYERFRDAIARGSLKPGERLPSARSLASQLATARGTVDAAYGLLAGEGYVVSRGAGGTVVAPELGREGLALAPGRPERRPRPALGAAGILLPFQMGVPAFDAFPRALWSRLTARRARALSGATMSYPDPAGLGQLREAIALYLSIARGINCAPDQIVITAGYQGALGLIGRVLLQPGERAWIEDPGYFMARQALNAAGARLVPVPVDGDGIDVAAGVALAAGARFAVVTPSHQAPLGIALALARRLALLAWAGAAGAWIIEDDYDSEFRYSGHPLPALKSLDRDGRVLYAGTFSKVLFPALRLGYLVVPEPLVQRFRRAAELLQPAGSTLAQAVVAAFMSEGHFARHIKRMRTLYRARRGALAGALAAAFAGRLTIELQAGGLHLLARLAPHESDQYLAQLANAAGLAPAPLSMASIEHDCGQGLLLNFTNIPAETAPREAARLARAIGDRVPPIPPPSARPPARG